MGTFREVGISLHHGLERASYLSSPAMAIPKVGTPEIPPAQMLRLKPELGLKPFQGNLQALNYSLPALGSAWYGEYYPAFCIQGNLWGAA